MKKTIKLILALTALALILTAFTGCEMLNAGVQKVECSMFGHSIVLVDELAPTCTEAGHTASAICENCGYVEKASEEIAATGHTWTDVEGKSATCTESGYKAYKTCECGATEGYEVIEAGHNWSEADENGTKVCYGCNLTVVSTTEGFQAALDCATSGDVIQLTENVAYGAVYMGRPTKHNNTVMLCETHTYTTTDETEFITHLSDGEYHTTPRYTTTLENITIIGAEGATVAGLTASSGHFYGDVYDYVRDKDYDEGSAYYLTLNMSNITFKGVNFTAKVDINTSDASSVYDGINFVECSFTTGGTESANSCALRYYNESNNGNVRNLTVTNCRFNNCYQGIYAANISSVSVTISSFDTTGHNAIALQSGAHGAVDMKVVLLSNTFANIADRIIRFGEIGAGSDITIEGNVATNSGDEDGEVMKAVSIADGITTSIKNNSWGGTVVDEALQDLIQPE